MPTLRTDRLAAGFLYWDARTDDARLTLTVLRTAVLDHGAVAANHTQVTGLLTDTAGRVRGATVAPEGSDPFEVRASVVVNACGVWADEVRALDEARNPHSIRPAKGIHITVPESALPCDIAAVIPVPADRQVDLRRLLGRPGLPRHHRHRVGRTARRPGLHARGRRLHPRGGQRGDHPTPHPVRHHRRLVGSPPAPGPRRPLPDRRAHRGPLPQAHRADLGGGHGHGHRGQAHHLPQDGPGHGRRRGGRRSAGARSPA